MPRVSTSASDPLSELITFRVSPVFEMLAELQTLAHPWKQKEWSDKVEAALGSDFVQTATDLYRHHHLGCDFVEFAIDYDHHEDVPGFIDYTESLPDARFAFYLLGRVVPLDQIPDNPDTTFFESLEGTAPGADAAETACSLVEQVGDLAALRSNLISVWRSFWNGWFKDVVAECRGRWEESIEANEDLLTRRGGKTFLEYLVDFDHLPDPIPAGSSYSTVHIVPICRLYRNAQMYYGYGNATILYDARRSELGDRRMQEQVKERLTVLRALGDENRLKIMKLLADSYLELNGKKIAEKMKLSPSVISRHLGQLRDAGLIEEHSPDNRNITYSVRWEMIEGLSGGLLSYLRT